MSRRSLALCGAVLCAVLFAIWRFGYHGIDPRLIFWPPPGEIATPAGLDELAEIDVTDEPLDKVLKSLADKDRLKVVQCLQGGERDVTEVTRLSGGKLANISHHLQILRRSKIVLSRRDGRRALYRLNPAVFRSGPEGDVLDLACCKLQLVPLGKKG